MAQIELHVHPFVIKGRFNSIISAMNSNGLDILALESFNGSIFPSVLEEAKKVYPAAVADVSGIWLPDGKILLNAREYGTKENLHVLTVGYSLDEATPETEIRKIVDLGLENRALIILDHPFVDNEKTKTAGHIPGNLEQELDRICKEYSGHVALEWNGYCIPWIRNILMRGLNAAGFNFKYSDVNYKAEELSARLKEQGFNVPVVADTDLHARTKKHLEYMGTARIKTDIERASPRDVVDSMRKNIFEGKYVNVKEYVDTFHLLNAFCIPILLPQFFEKPRA